MKLLHMIPGAIVVSVLLAAPSPLAARIWHVPAEAPTIQAGIDSAAAGDEVVITCGTYFEHDITLKSGVTVRGESGQPDCVVIDAERLGRAMLGENLADGTALSGLTFTNGLAYQSPLYSSAGGGLLLRACSPLVDSCRFIDNEAAFGAGMFGWDCPEPHLRNCTFSGNWGVQEGAGLYLMGSSPDVEDCLFAENEVGSYGAALKCSHAAGPTLKRCLFRDNFSWEDGGAVDLEGDAGAHFTACRFEGNHANFSGGAISAVQNNAVTLIDCTLTGNSSGAGGGVWIANYSILEAENTDIQANQAETGTDGHVGLSAAANLTCCAVDPANWTGEGTVVIDNEGCAVVREGASWGSVKAMYR